MEPTFKERLIAEKTDLDEKLSKLEVFVDSEKFKTIDPVQTSLLKAQLQAMATYSVILSQRLTWLDRI